MSTNHAGAQWFSEAKFGVIFCLCPSAVRGIEMSLPMRKGHPQHVNQPEYESLANELKVENYQPEEWVRVAAEAGVRYASITAKHHDGYCLWDTSTTEFSAPRTGPGRDLVRPFVDACRAAGIKVGIYWSPIDWHDPDFPTLPTLEEVYGPRKFEYSPERWERFYLRSIEQIRELLTNYGRIDLFIFDGPIWSPDRWRTKEIVDLMRNLQPHIVMNNRLPGLGDYATPEEYIPLTAPVPGRIYDRIPVGYFPQKEPVSDWWETWMSMHRQWAYTPDPKQYWSVRQLLRFLAEVSSKGGNYCLGIGVKPDGTLDAPAVNTLEAIGRWMSHSSSAIFADKRLDPNCFYGPMTRSGNALYLHVFAPPEDAIHLCGVAGEVSRAYVLKTGETLKITRGMRQRLFIELPKAMCDELLTVVAVEYKGAFKEQYAWQYKEHGALMVLPSDTTHQ